MGKNGKSARNDLTPGEFYLCQNYPNPFRERTTIKYCVAYKTGIKITVFNSQGRIIKKLVDEEKNPGTYEVVFHNDKLPAGHYCYRMNAGKYNSEKIAEILR